MRVTKTEQAYLRARAKLNRAKMEYEDARNALLKARGIECCRVSKAEAQEWECVELELASVRIAHFTKSCVSWDAARLENLARHIPEIRRARKVSYQLLARITPKAVA